MKVSYQFVIRPAIPDDIDVVQQLSIVTFSDTYAEYNTQADIQLYIAQHFNREVLLSESAHSIWS